MFDQLRLEVQDLDGFVIAWNNDVKDCMGPAQTVKVARPPDVLGIQETVTFSRAFNLKAIDMMVCFADHAPAYFVLYGINLFPDSGKESERVELSRFEYRTVCAAIPANFSYLPGDIIRLKVGDFKLELY